MNILDAVRAHVQALREDAREGHIFQQSLSRAAQHQRFADHFLRNLLPHRFGFHVGQAFAAGEGFSAADSLLVCDHWHGMPLAGLMPCEFVYAVCEAHAVLDDARLRGALENIAALKRLPRARATAHDISPTQHLAVFGARYAQLPDDTLNPYLGYIFAHTADDPRVLHRAMRELFETRALLPEHSPDAIICLRDGWMITRQTLSGNISVPRSSFARFGLWQVGDDLLTLVYLLLNVSLAQIQLRGPDLLRVLENYTDQIRQR